MVNKVLIPTDGAKIEVASDFSLKVPDNPIIPFIEGDGIGVDITPVMRKVVDAAVRIAYSKGRKIHWLESFCGEKATREYGPDIWLQTGVCTEGCPKRSPPLERSPNESVTPQKETEMAQMASEGEE